MAASAVPVCGYTLDGVTCRKRGSHRCAGRVRHVVAFFSELLTHTKGMYARQPFVPSKWQRNAVLAPLFGEVVWDDELGRYVRRYRILYLYVARKNGKSELVAGIVLYLLVADGEAAAEIYGLARDSGQAMLVFRAAKRMTAQSPILRARLTVLVSADRISDDRTGSFYQVAAGDAEGNLGEEPSGAYIDELLTQRGRDLFDAMKTSMGTRAQPLLMLTTTAESDPAGFAATEREWSERVAADPSLEPERLAVIYRAEEDDDWTKPATWRKANPALGDFLQTKVLAAECRTAQRNPVAQRSFRQYRLNLPVSKVGHAIELAVWDESAGDFTTAELAGELAGRDCYAGLDMATTQDLAAYALVFADGTGGYDVIWRHFCPASRLADLDTRTGGKAALWVARGELVLTDSQVTDYEAIRASLNADRLVYRILEVAFDPWNAVQLAVELGDDGWVMIPFAQSARNMSASSGELLRLIAAGGLHHGGAGIMRWQAGNAVTRTDGAGNVKFDKQKSAEKIDGLVAAVMGLDRALRRSERSQEYAAAGF
jgi:phage terminase large subunit-like protein